MIRIIGNDVFCDSKEDLENLSLIIADATPEDDALCGIILYSCFYILNKYDIIQEKWRIILVNTLLRRRG